MDLAGTACESSLTREGQSRTAALIRCGKATRLNKRMSTQE
jgi:hypothetical protein